MKKLIVVIFLLFIISQIKVFAAETIITTDGTLDDSYLYEKDKQIVENNVDWDTPGNYQVEYFNPITKEFSTKDIIIHANEELETGISHFQNTQVIPTEDLNIANMIFINNSEYFIFGSKLKSDSNSQDGYIHCSYVAYYANGMLQWDKVINEDGIFTDACLTNRGILLLGNIKTVDQGNNIIFYEINYAGNIIMKHELYGSLDDFGYKVFIDDNLVYYVGSTRSNDFYNVNLSDGDANIIVGYINLDNLDDFNFESYGNSGDDVFVDAVYNDNTVFVYFEAIGTGEIYHPYETRLKTLMAVDYFFSMTYTIVNELNSRNESLAIINGSLNLISKPDSSNILNFYIYDSSVNYQNSKLIILNDVDNIAKYSVVNQDSNIIILLDYYTGNISNNYIGIYDENYRLLIKSTRANTEAYTVTYGCYLDQLGKINFVNWLKNEGYLNITNFYNYQILLNEIETIKYIYYEKNILLNGKELNSQVIKNNVSINPYGLYTNIYQANSDDLSFIIPMNTYYKEDINIVSRETYDLDVKLRFNGVGYLNDSQIKTGYIITEAGKYVLEIHGNNGEIEIVSFSVYPLSENVKFEHEDNKEISLSLKPMNNENEVEIKKPNLQLNNIEYQEPINYQTYIILLGIILGVICGLFIPNKWIWRRKNV